MKFLKNFLLKLISKIEIYEKSRREKNLKNHFVSFKDDGVYLDGFRIIDKKAELQMAIFKILTIHCTNEILYGSNYISIFKICAELRKMEIDSYDLENKVRVSIYRIRNSASKVSDSKIKLINSSKWNGYRIDEGIFFMRICQV